MAKINKHGLKMTGLRKTSGMTEDHGFYSGLYVEIFYDKSDGRVWGIDQYSLGQNIWTVYEDENIVKICNASMHMTMQEIADVIKQELDSEASRKLYAATMWD